MQLRDFGKTGMKVSPLGFGGAEIGYFKADQSTVSRMLDEALDAGLNVIDTAECYFNSEELIGNAVSRRRKDYFLFTKCGHPDGPGSEDWSAESILASVERSLKLLKTDHLDLVQLHSCSLDELKSGEAIGALEQAKYKGLTRFIGYSGDGPAARYAVECGAFDALQTSASIADQESIELLAPLALEKGLGVIAKRPLANAIWLSPTKPENPYYQTYWERFQNLAYDFLALEPAQAIRTALRFTLSVPGVSTAIVGTTKPGRWRENSAMLASGPLPTAEFEKIRQHWKKTAGADWIGQT